MWPECREEQQKKRKIRWHYFMYGFLRQSRVSMLFKEKREVVKDNWIMFSMNLEITTLFLSPPFKDSALWYSMCLSWSMYVNTVSVN